MAAKASSRKPRARRRVPRGERESQMLDVAARVFSEQGFHSTSMEQIAKACGVTKPMLYAYFDSKEGLYAATVDRAGAAVLEAVGGLLAEKHPLKRLEKGVELMFGLIARDRHGWAVLFNEALGGGEIAERVALYRDGIIRAASRSLSQDEDGSEPPPEAIQRAQPFAVALLGGGEALARWWLTQDQDDVAPVIEVAKTLVRNLYRSCRVELVG